MLSRRQISGPAFFVALAFLTIGCSSRSDPKKTLSNFLEALKTNDYQRVYNYFAFKDRYTKSEAEFVKDFEIVFKETTSAGITDVQVSFLIDSMTVGRDSAKAFVKITAPEIMSKQLGTLFFSVFKQLHTDSLVTAQKTKTYVTTIAGLICIIKEQQEGWCIYANWEEQRRKEAEDAQYRLEYIASHLQIKNQRIKVYLNSNKMQLTGLLKNSGQKALKDVEIFIVCLDRNHKPCYILNKHPVAEDAKPLTPGEARRFSIDLSTAPGEWSKAVDIKVVNCKFKE